MKPKDKHIVITGGTSGIGLELVRQLHTDNRISVIARPSERLATLCQTFPQISTYEADFGDIGSIEKAADALVKTDEKIDILINNAAVQYTPRFIDDDFRYEHIKREIDINFTSVCSLIHLTLPALLQDKPSLIMNINSGLSLVPKSSSAIYCATKGALNIFSQSLAHQLEHTNIKVAQAFLPLVDTPMTEGRGSGKLSVEKAAAEIIKGLDGSKPEIDVGKVKILRQINRFAPALARKIMKAG